MMSGQELQEHIQALGLTQAEAAQLLGVSPRTVTRWCTEGEEVSGPAGAALRAWRRLDAQHLAWRPDSVSIVEDDAERIATHRQEAINLDDILRRVEARGGPQLPWAVSLPESEATLDRIHDIPICNAIGRSSKMQCSASRRNSRSMVGAPTP